MTTITSDWTWSCVESSDSSASRRSSRSILEITSGRMLVGDGRPADRISAGVAVYREPAAVAVPQQALALRSGTGDTDWGAVEDAMVRGQFGVQRGLGWQGDNTRFSPCDVGSAHMPKRRFATLPTVQVMSAGRSIEIYKAALAPSRIRCSLRARAALWQSRAGSHAHGDRKPKSPRKAPIRSSTGTRFSAWSTTAPYRITMGCGGMLRGEGIAFRTENDTEVAAGLPGPGGVRKRCDR